MGAPIMGAKTPATGGKGTAPVITPGATTTPVQPTQPQTPYTPIGTAPQGGLGMGGVAGKGNAPVQPTVPAQGGKFPGNPQQVSTVQQPAYGQPQQVPTIQQPVYPTVGSRLPNGEIITQQGIDQAKALNAAKGQGQVQPAIPQPAPVIAPAPIVPSAPVTPAPTGLAALSRVGQKFKAKGGR